MDDKFYLGLASELQAKLRRLSSFITHAPSIGSYHEEVLRSVLRPMLSDRFSLRTGFIHTKPEGPSRQGDILIVDEYHPGAYFFKEGNFAVLEHSAVVCAIEVKTKLTRATFLDAVNSLGSFHRVTPKRHHPCTLVFAYESQPFTPAILDGWYKAVTLPDDLLAYPMAVFALNRGLLMLNKDQGGQYGHHFITGDVGKGAKLRSLSMFLQIVRKHILMHGGDSSNPFEYAVLDGLHTSGEALRFGKGIVLPSAT